MLKYGADQPRRSPPAPPPRSPSKSSRTLSRNETDDDDVAPYTSAVPTGDLPDGYNADWFSAPQSVHPAKPAASSTVAATSTDDPTSAAAPSVTKPTAHAAAAPGNMYAAHFTDVRAPVTRVSDVDASGVRVQHAAKALDLVPKTSTLNHTKPQQPTPSQPPASPPLGPTQPSHQRQPASSPPHLPDSGVGGDGPAPLRAVVVKPSRSGSRVRFQPYSEPGQEGKDGGNDGDDGDDGDDSKQPDAIDTDAVGDPPAGPVLSPAASQMSAVSVSTATRRRSVRPGDVLRLAKQILGGDAAGGGGGGGGQAPSSSSGVKSPTNSVNTPTTSARSALSVAQSAVSALISISILVFCFGYPVYNYNTWLKSGTDCTATAHGQIRDCNDFRTVLIAILPAAVVFVGQAWLKFASRVVNSLAFVYTVVLALVWYQRSDFFTTLAGASLDPKDFYPYVGGKVLMETINAVFWTMSQYAVNTFGACLFMRMCESYGVYYAVGRALAGRAFLPGTAVLVVGLGLSLVLSWVAPGGAAFIITAPLLVELLAAHRKREPTSQRKNKQKKKTDTTRNPVDDGNEDGDNDGGDDDDDDDDDGGTTTGAEHKAYPASTGIASPSASSTTGPSHRLTQSVFNLIADRVYVSLFFGMAATSAFQQAGVTMITVAEDLRRAEVLLVTRGDLLVSPPNVLTGQKYLSQMFALAFAILAVFTPLLMAVLAHPTNTLSRAARGLSCGEVTALLFGGVVFAGVQIGVAWGLGPEPVAVLSGVAVMIVGLLFNSNLAGRRVAVPPPPKSPSAPPSSGETDGRIAKYVLPLAVAVIAVVAVRLIPSANDYLFYGTKGSASTTDIVRPTVWAMTNAGEGHQVQILPWVWHAGLPLTVMALLLPLVARGSVYAATVTAPVSGLKLADAPTTATSKRSFRSRRGAFRKTRLHILGLNAAVNDEHVSPIKAYALALSILLPVVLYDTLVTVATVAPLLAMSQIMDRVDMTDDLSRFVSDLLADRDWLMCALVPVVGALGSAVTGSVVTSALLFLRVMVRATAPGAGQAIVTNTENSVYEVGAVFLVGACLGLTLSPVVATVFALPRSVAVPGADMKAMLGRTAPRYISAAAWVTIPLLVLSAVVSAVLLSPHSGLLDWNDSSIQTD